VVVGGSWREELVRDPTADALDSLLCAVQAAWAYTKREEDYGTPPECAPTRDGSWTRACWRRRSSNPHNLCVSLCKETRP
jgi:hypothetical protein